MRNRQGALERRRLFFTRPAEGGGGGPGTDDNPSTSLIFHCFLPLLRAHASDRWEIFSFSSSHGPPPLLSLPTLLTRLKKNYSTSQILKTAVTNFSRFWGGSRSIK